MSHSAVRGDGVPIHPGDGCIAIMKEVSEGKLSIIGTGFYVTRYGLFLTARHVLDDLVDRGGKFSSVSYILHMAEDDKVYLRRILTISLLNTCDLAIGQADNFMDKFPQDPLMNLRGTLCSAIPPKGTALITYAYPENAVLDFTEGSSMPIVRGDYFAGEFLQHVTESDNPFIPYPHFETSIEVRAGASGGPVFDSVGRIVGVNCRGWDFRGGEFEGAHLSSIVPVGMAVDIKIPLRGVPKLSWEFQQIPPERRYGEATFEELARYGHIIYS